MHQHGGDIYSHKNVMDFSANINFRGMPEAVRQAARAAVDLCEHYPDPSCRQLREAIAVREQVEPEQIICGNGAAELIFTLAAAKRPRMAFLPVPTFHEYEQALETVGCQVEPYLLHEAQGFRVQEDFLDGITEKTDLVFFCNPNNPTGVVTEPDFLERVLERCEHMDALLVVDECFNDFLTEPERYSMKGYLSKSRHLFLLKAFTKMYAMAGLRLGYGLCGDGGLLAQMMAVRQPWSVSIPAQQAGIAAAGETVFAAESRACIAQERELLKQKLINLGYTVMDSAANYLFFHSKEYLYEECLAQGFLIRDCSNYRGLNAGWYRVAVRSREENQQLIELLGRLQR